MPKLPNGAEMRRDELWLLSPERDETWSCQAFSLTSSPPAWEIEGLYSATQRLDRR